MDSRRNNYIDISERTKMLIVLSLLVSTHVYKAQSTCDVHYDASGRILIADCSKRQLKTVPLHLPRDIAVLNLQSNDLTQLKNDAFYLYNNLTDLDLSTNNISRLESRAFGGLLKLLSLDLSDNNLRVNSETYPGGIFRHLWNLQILKLSPVMDDIGNGRFPFHIFEHLVNLKHLELSYWPYPNQSLCFQHLQKLKYLSVTNVDGWYGRELPNSTFAMLRSTSLTFLRLRGLIDDMDVNIFAPLSKLNTLFLLNRFGGRMTLKKAMRSLHSFSGRNMTTINLHGIQDTRWRIGSNDEITRTMMLYVSEICVDTFVLSFNRLRIFRADAVFPSPFYNCLKNLDLSENSFYGDAAVLFKLQTFRNLHIFNVGSLAKLDTGEMSKFDTFQTGRKGKGLTLHMPPMIERLGFHIHGHNDVNIEVLLMNTTNLHTLDLSHNGFQYIRGYVKGLCHVQTLYLSHGFVHPSAFENTDVRTSMEELYADYTDFPPDFLTSKTFLDIPHLRILDLSGQGLFQIEKNTFTRFTKLESLVLSENIFTFIPEEIYNMKRLKNLDLSFNALSSLPQRDMNAFDNIAEGTGGFYLHLKGNTFVCSCFSLGFIHWVHSTKVKLDNRGNYSCLTNEGLTSSTWLFSIHYEYHWRKCIGQRWFTVSIALFLLQIMSITTAFLLKKYSPKIENVFLNILGYNGIKPLRRKDFRFDAYITYEDSEYQWPCLCLRPQLQKRDNNIRLYLPDLHDLPGCSKADAIIDALSNSWKVVVVISERTFTDEWTHFTILSTVRLFSSHNNVTGRIILLYKDVSLQVKARVPRMLLNVVPEEHAIDVSDGDEFWSTLRELIMEENGRPVVF
ncbi:toll-like receptor 4 [Haliotis asinina]|uniref:toll-like receptor 4 n=1 Tax=Haliotis asinina TaxID=109174 RepID=UPI003532204B